MTCKLVRVCGGCSLLLGLLACDGPSTTMPSPPADTEAPAPAVEEATALTPEPPPDAQRMLTYVEERIYQQESAKDVRCWSSVQKLQMFLVDAPVEEQATYAKVEGLKALVHSIWQDASRRQSQGPLDAPLVRGVLAERFPTSEDADGLRFTLTKPPNELVVSRDALKDFGDAIDHWRVVQAWLMDHVDARGRVTLAPALSDDALAVLADFVLGYNLAVLSYARHLAHERKRHVIDAEAIRAALELEHVLARPTADP